MQRHEKERLTDREKGSKKAFMLHTESTQTANTFPSLGWYRFDSLDHVLSLWSSPGGTDGRESAHNINQNQSDCSDMFHMTGIQILLSQDNDDFFMDFNSVWVSVGEWYIYNVWNN